VDVVAHSDDVAISDALATNEHPPIAQDAGGRRRSIVHAVPIVSLTATEFELSDAQGTSPRRYPDTKEAPASLPGLLIGFVEKD
jgi:hypothetical protein